MKLCHLELELGGCNNEVAALQSDRYTDSEVPLYNHICTICHGFDIICHCIVDNVELSGIIRPGKLHV